MFERVELSPANIELWRSMTQEQKDVITILAENYDEVNNKEDWTFPQAIAIDDVDAATYTTVDQYLVWRSITMEQKNLVLFIWDIFVDRYAADLARLYEQEDVYNMNISYDMFALYHMFTAQDQLNGIDNFRFFRN
jgi:hypothetical protein